MKAERHLMRVFVQRTVSGKVIEDAIETREIEYVLASDAEKLEKRIAELEAALQTIEHNSRDCEHCSASLFAKKVLEERDEQ